MDKNGRIYVCKIYLFLANTLDKKISVFNFDKEKKLEKVGEIKLEIMPDNISYDLETDSFLVAGYTRILEYIINQVNARNILGNYHKK